MLRMDQWTQGYTEGVGVSRGSFHSSVAELMHVVCAGSCVTALTPYRGFALDPVCHHPIQCSDVVRRVWLVAGRLGVGSLAERMMSVIKNGEALFLRSIGGVAAFDGMAVEAQRRKDADECKKPHRCGAARNHSHRCCLHNDQRARQSLLFVTTLFSAQIRVRQCCRNG